MLLTVIDDERWVERPRRFTILTMLTYCLMRAMCEELISKTKAKQTVNDMVSSGWRCSIESYMKIMESLEKL